METKYEVWQTGASYRMCIGTFDTWDEAFDAAQKKNSEVNDEGNYWAEMEGENDYFFIVEEGLTPRKLKRALMGRGNVDFYARKMKVGEKRWRK